MRKSLESINDIKGIKDEENELNSEINYYIEFENNLNKIDELKKSINKSNSNKIKINFEYNNKELLTIIKKFGILKIENVFKENIEKINFNSNPLDNLIEEKDDNNFNIKNSFFNLIEEKDDKIIKIKFEKSRIEKILDIKNSKFINIDDIKIINIGNKSYKNLIFVKDGDNSSNDINFFGDYKNSKIHGLTKTDKFNPNDTANFNISLSIDHPKQNEEYKMIIYVREKGKDENLSGSLEIYIKITQEYDDNLINDLYKEFEAEYGISSILGGEEASKQKIRELNCNKDEITKLIFSSFSGETNF